MSKLFHPIYCSLKKSLETIIKYFESDFAKNLYGYKEGKVEDTDYKEHNEYVVFVLTLKKYYNRLVEYAEKEFREVKH